MFITAKFNSKCSETGQAIKKGDSILWIKSTKQVFCKSSEQYKNEDNKQSNDISGYVQANEDAYFDNFCQNNNI